MNKRTLIFALAFCLCYSSIWAGGQSEGSSVSPQRQEEAKMKVWEAEYYAYAFQEYIEDLYEQSYANPNRFLGDLNIGTTATVDNYWGSGNYTYGKAVARPPSEDALDRQLSEWQYLQERGVKPSEDAIDKAIAFYEEALRLDPSNARARSGLEQSRQRKQTPIAELFQQWLQQFNPESYAGQQGWIIRGKAYYFVGEYDLAIADLTQGIRDNYSKAEAYFYRGLVYVEKGDFIRAIADFSETINISPRNDSAYNARGFAYARSNDFNRARADFEEAIRLNPYDGSYRDNLALAIGDRQQQTQQEAQLLATPNSGDDFDIRQNAQGGITITGYKGTRRIVNIPQTIEGIRVTEIGDNAFYRAGLMAIVIPNTVTRIGNYAFNNQADPMWNELGRPLPDSYRNNLQSLTIPNSVTTIGDGAFTYCGIRTLNLGNGIRSIGSGAFMNNEIEAVTLPASLTSLEWSAFENNRLTSINIPNNINLSNSVFSGNRLTTIVFQGIPNNWSNDTFRGSQLTSVTLPANMPSVNLINSGLADFYQSQNRRAGTYTFNGRIWSVR